MDLAERIQVLNGDVANLEDRVDDLEQALHKIAQWAKAYPLEVFPEPVVEGVGKIAESALTNGDL